MSDYYNDVYLKRINRYGHDYQSRVQAQREREFEGKLLKSVYRVDFDYLGIAHPATLEPFKQNETELTQYLLTRVSLNLPSGTILMIPDKNLVLQPWMVYWLESVKASGYNRYIVLKMTHHIYWSDKNGLQHNTWCYLHGAGDSALKETLKMTGAIYAEDDNNKFVIMPVNTYLKKDDYIEIGVAPLKEAYRVTGYDIHSVPGVEYVTLNPMYIKDNSPSPMVQSKDENEDFYWLNGGEG